MKIDILTLFPEMFSPLNSSILKRAVDAGILEFNLINIRDFSKDKHKKCDYSAFGGGAGMLMSVQPIYDAIKSVKKENSKIIFPSPKGVKFDHKKAKELSRFEHLIFVCGHYEGVDERIFELFDIEEISLGDYVLAKGQGEIAEKIIQIALDEGIEIRQDADLIEILKAVDIEQEIPVEAFAAVAEIISYVYKANNRLLSEK